MFVPAAPPTELEPLLAEVRGLRAVDFAAAGAQGRAAWLVGLRQLVDAAEVVFGEALAAFDAHGDHEVLHGSVSSGSWLRSGLHLARGDAAGRVQLARRLAVLKPAVDGAARGALTFDQVRAVERATRPLSAGDQPAAVQLLTRLAETADAGQVRVAGRRLREVVDPDGAMAEHEQQFDRRRLTMAPLLDGMTALDGLLDTEAAAILSAALAPFMVPAGADDDRTAAQRRADALVEVAAVATKSDQLPSLSSAAVSVDVVVTVEALLAGRGGDLHDHPEGTAHLAGAALSRLACDASVRRVLLGPASVPLDLGRSVRLFTAHQRRALAVRDAGCRWPGCTRPSRHTDAHHLKAWTHGGVSDLANGLLLCRRHHRSVHEGGWTIAAVCPEEGANGTLVFTGPEGQRLPAGPRGP